MAEIAWRLRMRILGAVAIIALLTGSAYAQMPNINLLADSPSKTPEELDREAAQQKAYKESLKKIPDVKASSDPWGTVRAVEAPRPRVPAKRRGRPGSAPNWGGRVSCRSGAAGSRPRRSRQHCRLM